MEGFSQENLFAACRALYDMAGEKFVLPPLIRNAESHETQPGQAYDCPFGDRELRFLVSLDEAFADRNALTRSKLPLKFRVELCVHELGGRTIELLGREKYELIRAFLLGAKIPVSAENKNEDKDYSLSLQLSSTFFVDCGELSGENGDRVSTDICDDVARKIYERSEEFFADEQQGLTVWRLRAAQDLFGDVKPDAELFWPIPRQDNPVFVPMEAVVSTQDSNRPPRYAMAAAILVGLLASGVLAANFISRAEIRASAQTRSTSAEIRLASLQHANAAVPVKVGDPVDSAPPITSISVPALPANDVDTSSFDVPQGPVFSAVAGAAPLEIRSATVHDSLTLDDDEAEQAAVLFAPMPISGTDAQPLSAPPASQHSRPKTRPVFAAKAELLPRRRLARIAAKNAQDQSSKLLKFPQNALASLVGVVKTIGQIPGQIFKGDKRVKI